MKKCEVCGNEIPLGRLKVIPDTKTCVGCSSVDKKAGFHILSDKSDYSELQIVDQETVSKLNKQQKQKGSIN